MFHQPSRPFQLLLLAFMTVIFLVFPVPLWASDVRYTECGRPVQCGSIQNITYPFWGSPRPPYCGLPEFKIECQDEVPVIQIMSESFRVLKINHDNHILRLTRLDLYNGTCPSRFLNTTMNYLFSYSPHFGNLTRFFGCSSASPALASNKFSCRRNNTSSIETGYFTIGSIPTDGNLGNCNVSITVPVLPSAVSAIINNSASLEQVLNDGFEVLWIIDDTACSECMGSGGRCGYNTSHFQPICFCSDQPYLLRCPALPGTTVQGTYAFSEKFHEFRLFSMKMFYESALLCLICCKFSPIRHNCTSYIFISFSFKFPAATVILYYSLS